MEILDTTYRDGLLEVHLSRMEETLQRYNMTLEELDSETLETFKKLSEDKLTLALDTMQIQQSGKKPKDNSSLLYLAEFGVNRADILGRSNKNKDTDCVRINCLLPELYYLLAQYLPHTDCMNIINKHLPTLKDNTALLEANGNFQMQAVPEYMVEQLQQAEPNLLQDCSELLEERNSHVKFLAVTQNSIILSTEKQTFRCFLNHYTLKAFAKVCSNRVYGKSKTELESMSELEREQIEIIVKRKMPHFYVYSVMCYISYMCIIMGGGIEALPINKNLYETLPTQLITSYLIQYFDNL